jgi:hypothetical protein
LSGRLISTGGTPLKYKKTLLLEPVREAFHEIERRPELREAARRAKELAARLGC